MKSTSRTLRALALPAVLVATAGFTLTACGGSSDSSSSASPTSAVTTEAPAPNPNPEGDCSQEALNSAAANATGGTFGGVEEFTCDGGYAVVQGKMNDQYLPLLFKAEDGTWVPVEILNACQAGEVPAKVAEVACA
jgi:hypothetical protein